MNITFIRNKNMKAYLVLIIIGICTCVYVTNEFSAIVENKRHLHFGHASVASVEYTAIMN